MKVKGFEVFHCDAGWRTFSFLKIVTDGGIVGWSEYNESFGSPGLSAVIAALAPGRRLLVLVGTAHGARDVIALLAEHGYGSSPVRALAIPASSHPPSSREPSPCVPNCLPGPNGSS